jgi:hypothetical protein
MRPHADYDRYRTRQLAELEVSRRILGNRIVTDESTRDICTALNTLFSLQEREAKLLGLDRVPTPLDEFDNMTDAELLVIVDEWATRGLRE